MKKDPLHSVAVEVVKRLRSHGFEAYFAGGCVRDELLGLTPKDYDIATDARPEQVRRLFKRTVAVGASFGVIEVLGPEPPLHVQVATFRNDGNYSDSRHPDSVTFSTAREDAIRRDLAAVLRLAERDSEMESLLFHLKLWRNVLSIRGDSPNKQPREFDRL